MATELAAWRREFPICEITTYLISNSLGAMPRGTKERLAAYAEVASLAAGRPGLRQTQGR
jgi:kynureninase